MLEQLPNYDAWKLATPDWYDAPEEVERQPTRCERWDAALSAADSAAFATRGRVSLEVGDVAIDRTSRAVEFTLAVQVNSLHPLDFAEALEAAARAIREVEE